MDYKREDQAIILRSKCKVHESDCSGACVGMALAPCTAQYGPLKLDVHKAAEQRIQLYVKNDQYSHWRTIVWYLRVAHCSVEVHPPLPDLSSVISLGDIVLTC